MTERWPEIGTPVIFCDEHSKDHNALVTCIHADRETWGYEQGPTINIVHVSSDETKKDGYGRQIERRSSVCHGKMPGMVQGMYWRYPDEERNVRAPHES